MADPASYHHGDLRAALVTASLEIVEAEGAAALSLRGAARRAGVSAMAPYHHFRDRRALVAAVAARGFERLYAGKLAALASTAGDPAAAVVAGARNYVEFILDNPGLYRLMKSPELADRAAFPELAAAAAAPSAKLAELVGALAAAGRLGDADPADVARSGWGLAHGIGMLALDGYLGDRAAVLALAATAARALVAGFAAHGNGVRARDV